MTNIRITARLSVSRASKNAPIMKKRNRYTPEELAELRRKKRKVNLKHSVRMHN
jgi:hypothetical protein